VHEIIENRRSIRRFRQDRPVEKGLLNRLLEAAMHAPSARNLRPWEFVIVTNAGVMREIPRIMPSAKMCGEAKAVIAVVAVPQADMPEGYLPGDCGAATQNLLLEAVNLGLGACWCGVYPREERVSAIRNLLGIPEPKFPFCVVALGYPDESPPKKGRFEEHRVRYIE